MFFQEKIIILKYRRDAKGTLLEMIKQLNLSHHLYYFSTNIYICSLENCVDLTTYQYMLVIIKTCWSSYLLVYSGI